MGIEDRDYFRERKFSWVTGELLKPTNEQPLNQGKKMGIQDRDYMRERKLDYTSKYDGRSVPGPYKEGIYPTEQIQEPQTVRGNPPPEIPTIWVVLVMIIAGFSAAFWLLRHWN